jgi:hypothetical protein
VFHTRSSISFLDSAVTAIRSASRRDRGGSTGTLQLRQLAFSGYGLVFFVCAFDAVFELAPVVEKLLDHFAGRRRLDRSKVTISPTWNLCGAGSPCSAVQRVHLGATLRHAGWRPQI